MAKSTAPNPFRPGRWIVTKFGPPSVLRWQDFDSLPSPPENEALLRILVTGISAADNMQRIGGYPDPRTSTPGFTLGYDFVGEVVALGPGVSNSPLYVGDRVVSMCTVGAYATHITMPLNELIRIPSTDDPVKVAALPLNYMTAYGMLKRSGVGLLPGSTVLVGSASGGVGCALAQLAKAFDMGLTLYGTCSPKNFDFVTSLGVTPIDRHTKNLAARVKELNGGKGVDVAFDAAGSEKSMRDSFAATVEGTGQLRVIGAMSNIASEGAGLVQKPFDTFGFIKNGQLPRTEFWMVTHGYYLPHKDVWLKDFEDVLRIVRDGQLQPLIGQLFRLSDAIKANDLLATGAPFTGKMEFLVDSEIADNHHL